MKVKDEISDWDYQNLTELYYKNDWLREQVNHEGFENLWFDYKTNEEKIIIKKLISEFYYLTNERAAELCKEALITIIKDWDLSPENSLFVATKYGPISDGSSILINFIKGILREVDEKWTIFDLSPSIEESKKVLKGEFATKKKKYLEKNKIILIDDFVGTGGTAKNRLDHYKEDLEGMNIKADLYFFSLAGMSEGFSLLRSNNFNCYTCIELEKGIDLSFDDDDRAFNRGKVIEMEAILHSEIGKMKLIDHSLGYGKSEALYSWSRFNTPNNVFPIFWWGKYKNNKKRKSIFNRMQ